MGIKKIRDLLKQQSELEKQVTAICEQVYNAAIDVLKTDKIEFFSRQEYNDNDYYTDYGIESVGGIWVNRADLVILGDDDYDNISRFIKGDNSEDLRSDLDSAHLLELAEYFRDNKIDAADGIQAIRFLNELPFSFIESKVSNW